MVTFSKRRQGLFKKAQELSKLSGCEIAIITFSGARKAFTFRSSDFDDIITRYLPITSTSTSTSTSPVKGFQVECQPPNNLEHHVMEVADQEFEQENLFISQTHQMVFILGMDGISFILNLMNEEKNGMNVGLTLGLLLHRPSFNLLAAISAAYCNEGFSFQMQNPDATLLGSQYHGQQAPPAIYMLDYQVCNEQLGWGRISVRHLRMDDGNCAPCPSCCGTVLW